MTDAELIDQQREVYRRMWTEVPGYRVNSPGEKLVSMFLNKSKCVPGESLIDLGSGPGRASLALSDFGLDVTMLDITEEAPDPLARRLPLVVACLWDSLPLTCDWAYCCDVLEHIPGDRVDAVLDNLFQIGGRGAFMQIALWGEGFGRHIGETLHLSVHPADWWMAKISKRWKTFDETLTVDNRLVVMAWH